MRPISPRLIERLRCADPTARVLCEAQAELRSDVLKTKSDLQSADGFTARAQDFPTTNVLDAAAETTELTLTNAPAGNHLYEAHFKVTITPIVPGAGSNTHKVVVAVEIDAAGSGSWVEQFNFEYELIRKTGEPATAVTWPNERLPARVPALTSASKLRLKIKTASGPGGWSFSVHGFNLATDGDPLSGVTYHTGPAIDFLDSGGASLADTVISKISHGTSDGFQTDLNGPALSPAAAPFFVGRLVWGKDDSIDIAIDRIKAHLNPCIDGVPGNKDVAWFVMQCYALADTGPRGTQNAGALTEHQPTLVPLGDVIRIPAGDGTSAQDYTFSWHERSFTGPGHTIVTLDRKPRPKSIQPKFFFDGTTLLASEYDSSPTTFIFLWAIKADGTPASNVGWARNSAVTEVVNGSRKLRTVQVRRLLDHWFVEGPTALAATARPVYRMEVQTGSYAAANLEFTAAGNQLDLAATPTETVEFVAVAAVPPGTGSVFEVRNDADSAWLPFTDGQTAAEVGVSQREEYKVRWRGDTNTETDATPVLWEIGVRDVKKVWLSDLATVRAKWSIPDVAELVPAIPEAEITVLKNGEQDFRDRISVLLSENYIGSLLFRVWVGDPARPRSEWLHKDDFVLLDDYDPDDTSVTIIAHSALVLLNGALPIYNATTGQRAALLLANKTPKQIWDEIVGNQLAPDVPARYRGDGLTDQSCLLTKTITDSDGKAELDAAAHVAGVVLGTSGGRIRQFDFTTPGSIKAFFPAEKQKKLSARPGFRQRVPEFFVLYDYQEEEQRYRGEARLINGNALLNLKTGRIDPRPLRDEVSRWIPTELVAKRVGQRRVDWLGTGMLVWPFTSTDPHPELEFGDLVAVETAKFVARDPTQTTLRALKGALWAVGRVVAYDVEGRELAIWVQSYADLLGTSEVGTRLGIGLQPGVRMVDAHALYALRHLYVNWMGDYAVASVKIATSTSAYPVEGTGTAYNGRYGTQDTGALAYNVETFVTVTPYSGAGGTGSSGPAAFFKANYGIVGPLLIRTSDGTLEDATVPVDAVAPTLASSLANLGRLDLVLNGDFESGFAWWRGTVNGSSSIETGADKYKGAKSLKITGATPIPHFVILGDNPLDDGSAASPLKIRVTPGQFFLFMAAGKASAGTGNVNLRKYDDTGADVGLVSVLQFTTTSYVEKSAIVQVLAGTYYVGIEISHVAAANTYFFDEIHLYAIPLASAGFFDNGTKSGAFTVDWNNGPTQWVEINGTALAITLSNPVDGGALVYVLYLKQNSAPDTVTWPGAVHWLNGVTPTLSATTGRIDRVELQYIGGVYYGTFTQYFT